MVSQTEEALGWTAEGQKFAEANPVDIKAPEGLSLKNVPSFDRPMSAGPNDEWTGRQDELGNREYKSQLDGSTYFIKPDADQRTELEKIQQDIIPAVKKYLDNPTAPSKEQTIEFLKTAAGDAWETISIPGDLVSGKKDLGDVTLGQLFEIGGGMAGASTFGKVPGGDTSNTMRIFGGIGMEGTGTSKSFKKAKNLLKKYNKDQQGTYGDSDAEGEVGGIGFNENKKIWEETNWYVDPNDGQWRFYIDDSKSTLKPFKEVFKVDPKAGLTFKELSEQTIPKENSKSVLLKSFFDHKDLYDRYPELKQLNVKFYSDPTIAGSKILGSADSENNTIFFNLSGYKNYDDMESVVLHEIQHIVQDKEGFVRGTTELSIPPELVQKKDAEILQKIKPIEKLRDELETEDKALGRRLLEEIKKQEDNPLTGITKEQELEIRKLKYYDPETLRYTGPSWTSIAKDYGVKPGQIQKAWGRINLLDTLRENTRKLNFKIAKINSELYQASRERVNIQSEFYTGAGGEIESRLVQYMADGTKKFPVEARAEMLQKEGSKFQYQNKDGVDPLVYENKPRRNPEDVSFLDRLKGKIKKSIGSNSEPSQFAQGGVVNDMNRQMKMFAVGGLSDDGMSRDPVSGNEIPPGSMAEEVRDDIPAQLSEGEYVVPADVVRFFGVKYFEDLRQEAKIGLANMEANGRIGGEPIEPQMAQAGGSSEVTDQDLAQLEQMLSTGVANGGLMDKLAFAAKNDRVINQRLNAGGMVVGYAGGGQVAGPTASYADPNRVDAVIGKVMVAIQQKPQLLGELSKRGIQVSRTNPNMQAQQMDQANPPSETRKAFAVGGFNTDTSAMTNQAMGAGSSLPPWANTLGGSYTYAGPGVPGPEATAAPPANTEESCSAVGMGFDPVTNSCIVKPIVTGNNDNDDDGGVSGITPTEVEFKWETPENNYFEMSKEQLGKLGTGVENDFAEKAVNGILGFVTKGGIAGAILGGLFSAKQEGESIAELRAASIVAASRGFTKEAADLAARADTAVGNAGLLLKGADHFGGLSGVNGFVQQIAAFAPINFKINKELFGDNEAAYQRAVMASVTPKDDGLGKTAEERAAQKALSNKNSFEEINKTERPTTWTGGEVVSNQNKPSSNDKDSPAQAAAKSKAKAEAAASKLGVNLATGGRYKGGLMKKRKKK